MTLSMRALFGWVAFAAFAVAALTRADVFWMRLAYSAAVLFTAYACLAAVAIRGERRMFWIGAAVCSLGYFLLVSGWPTNANASRFLITQQLLEWIIPNRSPYEIDPFVRTPSIWSDRLFDDDDPPTR